MPITPDSVSQFISSRLISKHQANGTGFLSGKPFRAIPSELHLSQPYQPGRIPVVFVHGTFSNMARWARMFSTLHADPVLHQKYQFWFFLYNSSNPVLISAADLREELRTKVAELDPAGQDGALRRMVVVGHSQGGLLTKLIAVDTGDRLVLSLTGKNLETLRLPADKKAEARRLLMVEPVAEVARVVFISTPHRGSILSKNWVRTLIHKVVTLPAHVVETTLSVSDYLTEDVKRLIGNNRLLTSIDGMSPESPMLQALAITPLALGVTGHSIIAVKGNGNPQMADDGVVAYSSAHQTGMASEFIVRAGHSCQGHPLTIEEIRRILLEHLSLEAQPRA